MVGFIIGQYIAAGLKKTDEPINFASIELAVCADRDVNAGTNQHTHHDALLPSLTHGSPPRPPVPCLGLVAREAVASEWAGL